MLNLKNRLAQWHLRRQASPWSQVPDHHRVDRMILAILVMGGTWVACQYFLTQPDRGFSIYGLSYLAYLILTALAGCYAVTRIIKQTDTFVPLASVFLWCQTLLFLVISVANLMHRQFAANPANPGPTAAWIMVAMLLLVAAYFAISNTITRRRPIRFGLACVLTGVILVSGAVPQISTWYTIPTAAAAKESSGESTRISVERTYYDQYPLMDEALDKIAQQRPGITDLYFVGFAGDASQNVFLKEVRSVGQLFDRRFDTAGRSTLLINNRATVNEPPVANGMNLWYTLKEIGKVLDPEEDILFLFLTSHGSKDVLAVDFWPLQPDNLKAKDLREILDQSGIKWRVIVVSACYSGSFIDDLRNDHTLIMTAAHRDNMSFGCSNENEFTYFGRAYFDQALRSTFSFTEAFGKASAIIQDREREEGLTPSRPQIDIGAAIQGKLELLRRRLVQRHKDQLATTESALPKTTAPTREPAVSR